MEVSTPSLEKSVRQRFRGDIRAHGLDPLTGFAGFVPSVQALGVLHVHFHRMVNAFAQRVLSKYLRVKCKTTGQVVIVRVEKC